MDDDLIRSVLQGTSTHPARRFANAYLGAAGVSGVGALLALPFTPFFDELFAKERNLERALSRFAASQQNGVYRDAATHEAEADPLRAWHEPRGSRSIDAWPTSPLLRCRQVFRRPSRRSRSGRWWSSPSCSFGRCQTARTPRPIRRSSASAHSWSACFVFLPGAWRALFAPPRWCARRAATP